MLRTVQRYATEAVRDVETPTPVAGELAFIDDTSQIQVFDGSDWIMGGGGVVTGNIDFTVDQTGLIQNGLRRIRFSSVETRLYDPDGAEHAIDITSSAVNVVPLLTTQGNILSLGQITAATQVTVDATATSRFIMRRSDSGWEWRFTVLADGRIQLQSSVHGANTWTTIETWNPL